MDLPYDTATCNYFRYETTQEKNKIPANNAYFRMEKGFSFKLHKLSYSVLFTFYIKITTFFNVRFHQRTWSNTKQRETVLVTPSI
jgi:hypothetical protein